MKERGPIFANATWEDWERWHNRHRAGQTQIVDNKIFVTFVILLALFGGTLNATWIGQQRASYERRLREVNEESMRFLAGRRDAAVNQLKTPEAQVRHFLVRRDPSGSGLKEEEEDVYKKVLHPRDPTYIPGKNATKERGPSHPG